VKKIFILSVLFFTFVSSNAHNGEIHKYIVFRAYQMLERRYIEAGGNPLDLQEIKSKVVYADGTQCNLNYDSNHPIVAGSYQEDKTDPIYHYWKDLFVTCTHFWDSDDGDFAKSDFGLIGSYDNAYMKARNYLFCYNRNYTWNVQLIWPPRKFLYFLNSNLIDFYNTGNCLRKEIRLGIPLDTQPTVYPVEKRKGISYEILGRVAHLLSDMSVPAHAHVDEHATSKDFYETDYIGKEGKELFTSDSCLVNDDGFMPFLVNNYNDATVLKNLFCIMNQITQHFPSRDFDGNNDIDYGATYIINQKLNAWGNPFTHPDDPDLDIVIAQKTFNFCVGAVATLFYWFGIRTGMFNTEINNLYFNTTIPNPTLMIHAANSITLSPGFVFSGTEMILTTEAKSTGRFNVPQVPVDIPNMTINLDSIPTNIPVDTLYVLPE